MGPGFFIPVSTKVLGNKPEGSMYIPLSMFLDNSRYMVTQVLLKVGRRGVLAAVTATDL